jgi:hypothetical protein
MNLFGIGSIIEGVGKIADDLITSDEERLQIALKERAMDVGLMQGQIEVNKAEAQHKSMFVAGWRPFIGWVGGLALAYQFLLYPLMVWAWSALQAYDIIPCHLQPELISASIEGAKQAIALDQCSFKPPPTFNASELFAIVTGMLGIGGMRSFDKLKGTQTDNIPPPPK